MQNTWKELTMKKQMTPEHQIVVKPAKTTGVHAICKPDHEKHQQFSG